jgi:methionine synthase I (cobalamin-dependent)
VAKPNAGLPRLDETGTVAIYDITPPQMADYARQLARQQVKLLGACCGSTPAHIAAMKKAVRN